MHQHVNRPERQHVNHLERQRVSQAEHQHVNRPEYQQINHLLYASKTHHRIPVSQLEFLNLHVSRLNDPNLVQTEHPVIVVVLVEVVPEVAVVLAGVVLEEAVVEDGNNRFIYLKFHPNDLNKVKLKYNFIPGKKDMLPGIFFEPDSGLK